MITAREDPQSFLWQVFSRLPFVLIGHNVIKERMSPPTFQDSKLLLVLAMHPDYKILFTSTAKMSRYRKSQRIGSVFKL